MNRAFIDGQNLHLGTKQNGGWSVDFKKLFIYLKEHYQIVKAFYFLGYYKEELHTLYDNLENSGFTLSFKDHIPEQTTLKKGNVDVDIVFEVMRQLLQEGTDFKNILLISGDGDYKKLVELLIKEERFEKILFPNKRYASSLYKHLRSEWHDHLENPAIKPLIEYI